MLVLTADDVRRVFDLETALETTAEAALAHVEGRTSRPARSALTTGTPAGEFLVMPGTVERGEDGSGGAGHDRFGVKTWYTLHRETAVTQALLVILDPETGEEVLLDGSEITDLRTGAMTGLAARYLAPEGATVATIVGAGIQARTQALALAACLPDLRTIRITSRSAARRDAFVDHLAGELEGRGAGGIEVLGVDAAEEACRDADVVVAATTSATPVVLDRWIGENALVCSVGSHAPTDAELEPGLVARAAIVAVDTFGGGVDGAGDLSRPIADGLLAREDVIELGSLPGASVPVRGIRVFKSVGFAAADVIAAHRVARDARSAGLGTRIDLHGAKASE